MFTFVLIPQDQRPAQLIQRSKKGGLEADELQVYAKEHFKSELDGEARLKSVVDQLCAQGTDPKTLNPSMQSSILNMGTSLDIVTLQMPAPANNYIGISLYCDGNGVAKGFEPNPRATELARNCGHHNMVVFGDAFIGKCYDFEEEPWERKDFSLEELDPNSSWVKNCAAMNAGKNMNSYTTGGSLSNMLQQTGGSAASTQSSQGNQPQESSNISWTQTDDEVEIRIRVDASVTSKMIKINIKPTHLFVQLPTFTPTPENGLYEPSKLEQRLSSPEGIELFSKIAAGDSTWSVEGSGKKRAVVITLSKLNSMRWLDLIR